MNDHTHSRISSEVDAAETDVRDAAKGLEAARVDASTRQTQYLVSPSHSTREEAQKALARLEQAKTALATAQDRERVAQKALTNELAEQERARSEYEASELPKRIEAAHVRLAAAIEADARAKADVAKSQEGLVKLDLIAVVAAHDASVARAQKRLESAEQAAVATNAARLTTLDELATLDAGFALGRAELARQETNEADEVRRAEAARVSIDGLANALEEPVALLGLARTLSLRARAAFDAVVAEHHALAEKHGVPPVARVDEVAGAMLAYWAKEAITDATPIGPAIKLLKSGSADAEDIARWCADAFFNIRSTGQVFTVAEMISFARAGTLQAIAIERWKAANPQHSPEKNRA